MVDKKNDIKILFFSSQTDHHFKAISNAVPDLIPRENLINYADIDTLAQGLRGMLLGRGIVLILVRDEKELDKLIQMGQTLYEHTIILILDSTDEDLSRKALNLYPRYTSCVKKDYEDIALVLEKMICKIQKQK